MYDMAHESAWAEIMSNHEDNQRFSILLRPPTEKAHWHKKWHAIDTYLNDIRGILTVLVTKLSARYGRSMTAAMS